MKGTINSVEEAGSGVKDGREWIRWKVVIDGTPYSLFYPPGVVPGDMVEYETEQDGRFSKLKSFKKIELPKPQTNQGKQGDAQEGILRSVALKAAAEAARAGFISVEQGLSGIKYAGDVFLKWLQAGNSDAGPDDDIPF